MKRVKQSLYVGSEKCDLLKDQELVSIEKNDCKYQAKSICGRVIFKIEKHKFKEVESSLGSESEDVNMSFEEVENKRISAFSKVNFGKLNNTEKEDRLKNLAKLVKRLRRKVRNLEKKFKHSASKVFKKYVIHSLDSSKKKSAITSAVSMSSTKEIINKSNLNISIEQLCKALNILRSCENFEFNDQKHLIENLVNLIADGKLNLDSLNFRKICTQVRMFLDKNEINQINSKSHNISFSFSEKEIQVSALEYDIYSKYKDNESFMRTILGINEKTGVNYIPEKINFNSNQENMIKMNENKTENADNIDNTENLKIKLNNTQNIFINKTGDLNSCSIGIDKEKEKTSFNSNPNLLTNLKQTMDQCIFKFNESNNINNLGNLRTQFLTSNNNGQPNFSNYNTYFNNNNNNNINQFFSMNNMGFGSAGNFNGPLTPLFDPIYINLLQNLITNYKTNNSDNRHLN